MREKLRRNTAKSKLMIASCRKAISGRNVFPASNSILLLQLNLIQKRCISFKEPYFMQKKRFWGIFSWNYSYALDCQSDSFHNHLNLFCLFNRYLYLDTIQTWHAFLGNWNCLQYLARYSFELSEKYKTRESFLAWMNLLYPRGDFTFPPFFF